MASSPLTLQTGFALEAFILDAQARNLSPRTIRYYRQQLGWFNRHLIMCDVRTIDQMTAHHIRQYLVSLQIERNWRDSSVQAAYRAIRAFVNFCHAEELIGVNPIKRVKCPRADVEVKPPLSLGDIQKLLDACRYHRDRAIILCLLDTGCRASEFLGWDIGDVNITTGIIRVRHTKARAERSVFLGNRSRRELIKVFATQDLQIDAPVWRTLDTGERLTYHGLKSMLRSLGDRAGVKDCSAHAFRRTFAVLSLRNGMNIYALQRIMGHSDISVLRHYLKLVNEDLLAAHRSYGAVDNMLKS